jgi:hypothetical protein
MSTTLPSVIQQHQSAMLDAQSQFMPEDYQRHVEAALADFSLRRPQQIPGTLTLVADQALYDCPAGLMRVIACDWGRAAKANLTPWDRRWPGRLPEMRRVMDAGQTPRLYLSPPPTAIQLGQLGSLCLYRYAAAHTLTDTDSSLTVNEVSLLLLRSLAEAMKELAVRHTTKPVALRDGLNHGPKNGTPSFLYTELLKEFERRVML